MCEVVFGRGGVVGVEQEWVFRGRLVVIVVPGHLGREVPRRDSSNAVACDAVVNASTGSGYIKSRAWARRGGVDVL
jgi:hypothetical protein